MAKRKATMRKIAISLPIDLVEFADRYAEQTGMTRGQVVATALAKLRQAEEERLAMEGYRFSRRKAVSLRLPAHQLSPTVHRVKRHAPLPSLLGIN